MHGAQQFRILILDRNIDLAALLKDHLRKFGLTDVYLNASIDSLQDLVDNDFFHLAFLDADLVWTWLQQHKPSLPCPGKSSIVMVHWDFSARVQECMSYFPAFAFLKKPYEATRIQELVFLKQPAE